MFAPARPHVACPELVEADNQFQYTAQDAL